MGESSFELALKPSASAHRYLFWIHLLPLCLLPFAVTSPAWLVTLAVAIGLSWLYTRRHRSFGFGRGAIAYLRAKPEGGWMVGGESRKLVDAELLGSTVIAGRWLILNFRLPESGHRSRVLLGDETTPEGMRRLRARVLAEG